MSEHDLPWYAADLVAVDLEGSGAGDPEGEQILEIAFVPLKDNTIDSSQGFSSMVNPGRRIVRKPWISPGLTNDALAQAPTLEQIRPEIRRHTDQKILVGHNVKVDWRLLRSFCPELEPRALIDTLKLARFLHPQRRRRGESHTLSAWIDSFALRERVSTIAAGGEPHRALWDTVAAGLLLEALLTQDPKQERVDLTTRSTELGSPAADVIAGVPSLSWLLKIAGVSLTPSPGRGSSPAVASAGQSGLWE